MGAVTIKSEMRNVGSKPRNELLSGVQQHMPGHGPGEGRGGRGERSEEAGPAMHQRLRADQFVLSSLGAAVQM